MVLLLMALEEIMRVLISGASGLIGRALSRALAADGHEPVALVRRAPSQGELQWNPAEPLDPEKLAGCDAVVHLAGKAYRRSGCPRVFISASAIGYYGNRGDELLTEESSPGTGYLADVSQRW